MREQDRMQNVQLRNRGKIISKGYSFIHAGEGKTKMREIKLSEIKARNLRTHDWVQHNTTEDLKDGEVVFVKGVGECEVRVITSKNLVELWVAKGEDGKT